jgi:hypothetical protein
MGAFVAADRGFFLCLETDTSPVGMPDCVLGYVVPAGEPKAGRLRRPSVPRLPVASLARALSRR